nr:FxSxx-COOH system tetratricopeptide repeat protein [Lentzea kentuckyensis]
MKPEARPGFPGGSRALASAPRFPGALPAVWNVPARNPNFTGRSESIARLRDAMHSSGTVAVHSLRGLGGVGKSQIAIEYAHRFASDFDVVWWIPSAQPALIPDHLAQLARVMGTDTDPASVVAVVLAALRGEQRWLLVFDNAEDPNDIRPYIPSGAGQVLITTRRALFGALGTVLDVDVLDRAESISLLRRRVPAITQETAEELSELLGDLPLAIEQASAYLEVTGLWPTDYVSLLRTHTVDMISRGVVDGRQETLATLWSLSLATLTEQHPAAVQLLDLLAWLAPEPIPLDLFTNHPDVLPQPLAGAAADPLSWADTVGRLVDWFLVRRDSADVTIAHRMLQHSLRNRTRTEPATEDLEAARVVSQALLTADLPAEIIATPKNWPRWRALLPHALAVHHDLSDGSTVTTPHSAWLLDRTATYLQTHGRPDDARPLFERALALYEDDYGPNHPQIATCLSNLGSALTALGRPDDARPLFKRALAIDEAAYGPHHPHVAIRLSNLGSALSALGLPSDARPLFERALAIDMAAYGPKHPHVATCLSNLGSALNALGRHDDARPLFERALAIYEATYGPKHPEVAACLSNLGSALSALGLPSDARPLFERALAIDEAAYGPHHPDVATCLTNLGLALNNLGRPDAARPLFERAIGIYEAAYGPNHPHVATCLSSLGLALNALGRHDDVRPWFERAQKMRKKNADS